MSRKPLQIQKKNDKKKWKILWYLGVPCFDVSAITIEKLAERIMCEWYWHAVDGMFAGTHMVFFLLNVVEVVGVLLTFKPFLETRTDQDY